MCRKTTFASSTTVNLLAVNLVVAQFNLGKSVGRRNIFEAVLVRVLDLGVLLHLLT